IIAIDQKKSFNNTTIEIDNKRKMIRLGLVKNLSQNQYLKDLSKLLSLVQMLFKQINICRIYKPACINAHSVGLLPFCSIYKILFNCKLIYDAHELETEVDGLTTFKKR